jgi:hypothetical protein
MPSSPAPRTSRGWIRLGDGGPQLRHRGLQLIDRGGDAFSASGRQAGSDQIPGEDGRLHPGGVRPGLESLELARIEAEGEDDRCPGRSTHTSWGKRNCG